ncbi:MAG: MotA/TolQ/ExbB proton channel family protein [Methylococcaceae bacterium]
MNQKGKKLAIWGLALQLGLVVGPIGTIIGMIQSFGRLPTSETAQAAAVATDISIALHSTVAGLVVALVGDILILVALFGVRYRAPWFRTALWVLSILWLLIFPICIILAIVVMVYLVNHKNEFTDRDRDAP